VSFVPQQLLLHEAIAVFVTKAQSIQVHDLRQGNAIIEQHEPTFSGIPFRVGSLLALDTHDTHAHGTGLQKMQVVPPTQANWLPFVLALPAFIGLFQRFRACPLKERSIFRRGTSLVDADRRSIQLAIALEALNICRAYFW
jgi:hypothetical protein